VQRREIYAKLIDSARRPPVLSTCRASGALEPWQTFIRPRPPVREPPGVCIVMTGSRGLRQTMSGSRKSNFGCAPWMRTYFWRGSASR
jgi:hypothetical protein